jgi:hypothetical protein
LKKIKWRKARMIGSNGTNVRGFLRKLRAVALAVLSGIMVPLSMHMFQMDMDMASQWVYLDIACFAMAFIGFGEAYWIYTKES